MGLIQVTDLYNYKHTHKKNIYVRIKINEFQMQLDPTSCVTWAGQTSVHKKHRGDTKLRSILPALWELSGW